MDTPLLRFSFVMLTSGCLATACHDPAPAPRPSPPTVSQARPARTYSEPEELARSRQLALQELRRRPETSKEALPFAYHVHFEGCQPAQCVQITQDLGWDPFTYETATLGFPIWLRACVDGVPVACKYAAQVYQDARLTLDSEPKVMPFSDRKQDSSFLFYMRRACLLDTVHCTHWADHTLDQKHLSTRLLTEAKARLTVNCHKQDVYACASLADSYMEGHGLPKDLALARLYYERSCEASTPDSKYCGAVTLMMLTGQGGPAQPQRAMDKLGDLCDPGTTRWAQQCQGDPDKLTEVCDVFKTHNLGTSCIYAADLMRTQGPEGAQKAARIQSALCTSMLLKDKQTHVLHACRQAQAHHREHKTPLAYRRALHARRCELEQDICITTRGNDHIGCINASEACVAEDLPQTSEP